ncbi:hypothetical protein HDF26_004230 [Pedobacter cryoconitis]|uniref:hypothetical protein n=1 Tax=Pedobacter cryoconitis TaxID=188932 RepID=UPI00161A1448|nr:hypothetical protein [Pedobacter cryoconitis]MBB6273770.1 hypothetical protein [Pedobacter cryoconitis]
MIKYDSFPLAPKVIYEPFMNTNTKLRNPLVDILKVCDYAAKASIYIVHLEAASHGTESRAQIQNSIEQHNLSFRCVVPEDGTYLF